MSITISKYLGRLGLLLILLISAGSIIAQDMTYSEAPELAEMVAAGTLPEVADRLPDDPFIVTPLEIGEYGGTWRRTKGPSDWANLHRTIVYEPLVRWDTEYKSVIPNVAQGWEINDDGTEITFFLRPGLKWSDGMPFTAADVEFWYEAVATNEELTPGGLYYMDRGGETADFTLIDDYTVKFTFAAPAGLFLEQLSHPYARGMTYYPKHYFAQFHPDYVDDIDELNEQVEAAGVESWTQLFMEIAGGDLWNGTRFQPHVPALEPWVSVTEFSGDNTQLRMVRNPYYFKVDPDGKQYPYFDEVLFSVIEDAETMVLMAAAGEIDVQWRHINSPDNRAFFFDGMEDGGYHFFNLNPTLNNEVAIHINQTIADPIKREMFQNKDFRVALSHAIDRQEIIDLLYFGQGTPHQAAPLSTSPYYDEEFSTQYTEFNIDLANQLLDNAGYSERNADGYRVDSEGNPITILILTSADIPYPTSGSDVAQMIADDWQQVGLNALARSVTGEAVSDMWDTNMVEVWLWHGFGGIQPATEPMLYLPESTAESHWGQAWAEWYNGSSSPIAEEPNNPAITEQFELYEQLLGTVDAEQQATLVRQILDIAKEEFFMMGITTPISGYGIVRNNVRNVPENIPFSWEYPSIAPTNTFTFFFAE